MVFSPLKLNYQVRFVSLFTYLAEAQKAERQALINMGHLISSTCEVLALLQLLCYHQFHAVTATLTQVCKIVLVSSFYFAPPPPLFPHPLFIIYNFYKSSALTWSVAFHRSGHFNVCLDKETFIVWKHWPAIFICF